MSEEVFGRLFDEGEIETGAETTLRTWLPTYLQEKCEQAGHGKIAPPQSFAVSSEYDRFPEEGLPAVLLAVPGTIDTDNEGNRLSGVFELEVAVTLAAARGKAARAMANIYGAAVRGVLMTQPELADGITVVQWTGSNGGRVPSTKRRTQLAISNTFAVRVDHVLHVMAGPLTPDSPDELPLINSVEIEVDHLKEETL